MTTQRAPKAVARIAPEDVKRPQDHQAPDVQDITVEFAGDTFTVKAKAVKDYRILMMLKKVEQDATVLPDVLMKLLGEEQHERMILAIEDEEGFVDLESVGEFLQELMKAGNRKNS